MEPNNATLFFQSLVYFLNKLLGSLLGLVLSLLLISIAAIVAVAALSLFLLMAPLAIMSNEIARDGFLGPFIGACLVIVIVPVALIAVLVATLLFSLYTPVQLVSLGWEHRLVDIPQAYVAAFERDYSYMAERVRTALDSVFESAEPVAKLTEIDLHLSAKEIWEIEQNDKRLDDNEITLIKSSNNNEINELFNRYEALIERLDKDECPVSLGRPEKDNTIVLMKQYYINNQWLPVPNSSTIFDKESLNVTLSTHTNHPLTRDSFLSPPNYEGHETRHRIHPYYTNSKPDGISQELNCLCHELRKKLTVVSNISNNYASTVNAPGVHSQISTSNRFFNTPPIPIESIDSSIQKRFDIS